MTEELLARLDRLAARAGPAPWCAMVEGRDHMSGASFIMIGAAGDRREDMYVSRDSGPADPATLDFIAEACTSLPTLIAEIRRLRQSPA